MDIKPVNQINFDYNGKHYCLEYTRDTVKMMEGAGFTINDIDSKPATRIEQLWAGAFMANHRKVSNTIVKELYGKMKDKDALLKKLAEMYNATLDYLLPDKDEDDEGNVEWTATL